MPTLEPYKDNHYLWKYVPSLVLSIVFTALFGIATIAHTWRMVRSRMWFCIPFVVGGLFEVIGYLTRAFCYNATGALVPYLLQAIFLVLPPVFFAASLYMVYARVVRAVHGDRFSLLTPRMTTVVFVSGDWFCLNIQSTGSGLLAKPKNQAIGDWIIVAGLGLQVIMFAVFMVVCLTFHARLRARLAQTCSTIPDVPWQACLNMLYATSLLILVRNVYRVVEFVMGQDGYLLATEWPAYAFDGVLMLLVMIAFFIWYPSDIVESTQEPSLIELPSHGASFDGHAHVGVEFEQKRGDEISRG
ncbi:hypothetical protein A1O3_04864 [Capronia epimyces CBS 606.96]|uniref:Uncharacterized protein n=1 Tax=Capronia epimyces CBS 606.96 TaxID=1182542 RepID=W9XUE3_9EURO|nr:uncharacterized protein A1O3_04864 [Capronia epimyces CBS 606.96]EXJ84197.1 hypothetical protein A1O3_04864 [Capronia epimyces CBS 606.96]